MSNKYKCLRNLRSQLVETHLRTCSVPSSAMNKLSKPSLSQLASQPDSLPHTKRLHLWGTFRRILFYQFVADSLSNTHPLPIRTLKTMCTRVECVFASVPESPCTPHTGGYLLLIN